MSDIHGELIELVDSATGEVHVVEAARIRDKPRIPAEQYLRKLIEKNQTVDGREIPDPTPMAPPIGWQEGPDMVQLIREMVMSAELRRAAEAQGDETLEDADDFEVDDDDEPYSAYEMPADYEPVSAFRARMDAILEQKAKESKEAADAAERLRANPQPPQPAPAGDLP